MRPLHRQTTRQVPHRRLRRIIRRLRLRHIDNRATHTPNHDNTPRTLPLHQVLRHARCEHIRAIDVDSPKFPHAVDGILDCVKVLRETSRSDQVVDFAVGGENFGKGFVDGVLGGDVGVVSGDGGDFCCAGVLGAEGFHEQVGLFLGFILCAALSASLVVFPSGRQVQLVNVLFRSTIATSAPLTTSAWLITSPNPLAPPVTTPTRSSKLKVASVLLKWNPPRPCTGFDEGRSSSSGYSTLIRLSVRECWPSCSRAPSFPAVVYSSCIPSGSSDEGLSKREGDDVKVRIVRGVTACLSVGGRVAVAEALDTCRSRVDLNILLAGRRFVRAYRLETMNRSRAPFALEVMLEAVLCSGSSFHLPLHSVLEYFPVIVLLSFSSLLIDVNARVISLLSRETRVGSSRILSSMLSHGLSQWLNVFSQGDVTRSLVRVRASRSLAESAAHGEPWAWRGDNSLPILVGTRACSRAFAPPLQLWKLRPEDLN